MNTQEMDLLPASNALLNFPSKVWHKFSIHGKI